MDSQAPWHGTAASSHIVRHPISLVFENRIVKNLLLKFRKYGLGSLLGEFIVLLSGEISLDRLKPAVDIAWTRLRGVAPVVAYRTKAEGDQWDPEFYEYIVPAGDSDPLLKQWRDETIVWYDNALPLLGREKQLGDDWWKAADGRYTYVLHVAQDVEAGKWQFMCVGPWFVESQNFINITFLHVGIE